MSPIVEKHQFEKYASQWFSTHCRTNIASATIVAYERNLRLYILPAFGRQYVEDISETDIQALFDGMGDRSIATKNKCKMVLNMILDQAVEDNIIQYNPMQSKDINLTGKKSKAISPYSVEQMNYIVDNLDRIKKPEDRTYIAIQALHPLKLEEVLGLKWEDIDLEHNLMHIRRVATHPTRNQAEVKEPQAEASKRSFLINEVALKYLKPGNDSDFVLGKEKPYSYTQVRRMCERIQKDIEFDQKIVPIRFRTTILVDVHDQTNDTICVQLAAGHTSTAMARRQYSKYHERSSEPRADNALGGEE